MLQRKDRKAVLLAKIKPLVPSNPESQLFFAVFEQAVGDLYLKKDPKSKRFVHDTVTAANFLSGPIPYLAAIGITKDWVQRLMNEIGMTKDINLVFDEVRKTPRRPTQSFFTLVN